MHEPRSTETIRGQVRGCNNGVRAAENLGAAQHAVSGRAPREGDLALAHAQALPLRRRPVLGALC